MLIKTEIIGNLVRDAVVRDAGDRQVLSFTLAATAASWTDKDGNRQSKTEFAECSVWGAKGSFDKLMAAQLMSKGHMIRVEATPDTTGAPQYSEKTGQHYNNVKYTVPRNSLGFVNTPNAVKSGNAPQQQQQAPVQQQQQQVPVQQQQQQVPVQQQQQQVPVQQQQQQVPVQQQQQQVPVQQQQQVPVQQQQQVPVQQNHIEQPPVDFDDDIPF